MTESHLSPEAHQRLSSELDERRTARRREISAWIERAREHGDISENADYDAAKNEQGHNEARVRHLQELLNNAVVVENVGDIDSVIAGCVVSIRFDDDDDTTEYLVGSIEERHDTYDVLSISSPLGLAIMGASPGEQRSYEGPRGNELRVEVVSVEPLG